MTDGLRQSFHRLRSFFRGGEHDRDFDAAMSAHLVDCVFAAGLARYARRPDCGFAV